MKVYQGYPHHWFCPHRWTKKLLLWAYGYRKNDDSDENVAKYEKVNAYLYNRNRDWLAWLFSALDDLETWIDSRYTPKIRVHIDTWDVWNADVALARVILPTLKLLKARKLGTAFVDNEDLPKELHKVRPDNDPNSYGDHERRWHWVLDEMIWAMEQIVDDSADGPTNRKWAKGKLDEYQKHQERVQRGTKLFGKYFQHLWD